MPRPTGAQVKLWAGAHDVNMGAMGTLNSWCLANMVRAWPIWCTQQPKQRQSQADGPVTDSTVEPCKPDAL